MPCEHLCAFLGGCVLPSGCHPKYSRSAERGDIDDWLSAPGGVAWVGATSTREQNSAPDHPTAAELRPSGGAAASSIRYHSAVAASASASSAADASRPAKRRRKKEEPHKAMCSRIEGICERLTKVERASFLEDLALHVCELEGRCPGKVMARGGAGGTCVGTPVVRAVRRGQHAGERRGPIGVGKRKGKRGGNRKRGQSRGRQLAAGST